MFFVKIFVPPSPHIFNLQIHKNIFYDSFFTNHHIVDIFCEFGGKEYDSCTNLEVRVKESKKPKEQVRILNRQLTIKCIAYCIWNVNSFFSNLNQ